MTSDTSLEKGETQARLLAEALPFMQRYENKTIVVKYGGHAMGDISLGRAFARDIALLKQSGINPIVVHGGGPQIGAMLTRMGIESKFEGGLARHRPEDGRDRRNGAGRLDQQGDRGADQRRGRMGDRPVRQGRQHGVCRKGAQEIQGPGFQHRARARPRLCRRAGRSRPHAARSSRPLGNDPGHRAGRAGPRRAYLQHQCRHFCRRHRRRAEGGAPAVPDRCAGRARQGQEPYQGTVGRRGAAG